MEVEVIPSIYEAIPRTQKHLKIKNNFGARPLVSLGKANDYDSNYYLQKSPLEHFPSEPKLSTIPARPNKLTQLTPIDKSVKKTTKKSKVEDTRPDYTPKPRLELPSVVQPKNLGRIKRGTHSVPSKLVDNDTPKSVSQHNSIVTKDEEPKTSPQISHRRPNLHISSTDELEPITHSNENSPSALPKIQHKLVPRDLVFSPDVKEITVRKHALALAQGIRYAYWQVEAPPLSTILNQQVSLKNQKKSGQKTLVLDLDETLMCSKCTIGREKLPSIDGSDTASFFVNVRPYAEEFLREMSKEFEIIIFTAAEKKYAEEVVKVLDPEGKYISQIFHREHCLKTKKGYLIKDLRIIKDRDLKDMVIVDNLAYSFSFQIDNGIPIITWEGDQSDAELKYLMDYLLEAKTYDDMRELNRKRFQLEKIAHIAPHKFAYGML